ncbi:amidohydrolase family protein [Kribbella kalugense]|uniref:Cytosine/adenosine deaminase-related metal-dependent hydrolase n=1 Tax=Kribbella kalugense TaxID=2512221 RepID=A0A4R7ZJA0_9ACTN|nr:amidohydrolase family protein [Kribbella kalugense]TDW17375.1 cytosine/adenosine deaminase-related metal-dependent hydrolase [Kribbella kalugense]
MRRLLKGGTVIDTFPEVVVRPETDVLIEDGRIAAVGPGLDVDAEVIDATGRIVLPGFVDTHRHLWQTALRGITVDADLGVYFERVLGGYGARFRAEDVAAGNLVGALECLDAGITTVQDYSHVQRSPEHADAALDSLERSGIRAVFGYGPSPLSGGVVDAGEMRRIMGRRSERLGLAVAAIGPSFAPFETVRADWELADSLGVPVVVHISSSSQTPDPITQLRDAGLTRPNTLYVHGNNLPDSELKVIADTGAAVSVTPTVEARMEMGQPLAGRLRAAGVDFSLGIDVVTTSGGDMFRAMHELLSLGYKTFSAAYVLQLATVCGARALGLTDVGSLAVGNKADVLLIRSTDINLVGGLHDPVATVVTAAHPGNVDTVLVGGTPVKRDGQLISTSLTAAVDALTESTAYLTA